MVVMRGRGAQARAPRRPRPANISAGRRLLTHATRELVVVRFDRVVRACGAARTIPVGPVFDSCLVFLVSVTLQRADLQRVCAQLASIKFAGTLAGFAQLSFVNNSL
ncbi:hypothetical protein EVAR_11806_1 [Eumeta japonica]|uniref:Uncharacterized protein n=1 Tax=Eumeta variegata TaxID=151549 RepID=A0A4C1UR72_EUMVA|nr:hypothetical protein EVAR_11806_1 [Eumeta japonica]